jgi:soluble lytic murein transglycosylase-like protein
MRNNKLRIANNEKGAPVSLFVIFALLFVFAPGIARADIVVFKTGRTMSVQSYRVDGDRAMLVLRDGGEASFSATLVERVDPDEVPYPVPAVANAAGSAVPVERPFTGPSDEVLAARPFAGLISSVAQSEGVPVRLVHALIEVESNYEPRAQSPKGARGLMQLMPATARQYGVRNSYDPKTNLEAGVRHLKDLLSRLELPMALAAYNAGEGAIRRYGGLPPFPETQGYVSRILQKIGR